jgi:small subunit ribosomal protein S4
VSNFFVRLQNFVVKTNNPQIAVVPDWLLVDKDNLTGSVVRIPTREEINPIVNEQLVVELYAR